MGLAAIYGHQIRHQFPCHGRGCLVTWHDFQRDSALLNVNLDGKVSVLLRSSNPEVFYAIPSPNGRLIAITKAHSTQNVWQSENF
jgi:hypothetical protein